MFVDCKPETNKTSQTPSENENHLGVIKFDVNGDEKAKAQFKEGVLLMHSFEYEDARDAFLKAQELDPTMPMNYWGEAMTYNHSLWQRQKYDEGIAALAKLAPTKEERLNKLTEGLEKDLFKGTEILFGTGTKYDRDVAYSDYMETLVEKYPKQNEIAAFYAISLLGASRNGRDQVLYDKAASIAKGIIKENPKHPGALHYLIHSYDDPKHAHLAKNAADSYSKVAPDAAHALHMPSHIYVALGDWDNVVASNIASWNASYKRKEKKALDTGDLSYHALHWLQYGLLQKGKIDEAAVLLDRMADYQKIDSSQKAKSYLIAMTGAQMVESQNWKESRDLKMQIKKLNLIKKGNSIFMEGMKAHANKDEKALASAVVEINKEWQIAKDLVGEAGFSMCSAGGYASKPPNQLEVDMTKVMELELKAMQAQLKVDYVEAERLLKEASELDNRLSYSYGPPKILKPALEAFAELLLEQGKYQEALLVFNQSLKRNPNRLISLNGKLKAMEALMKSDAQTLKASIASQTKEETLPSIM
jgi:tetratricopeptide (TPR) repeat protein